MTSRINTFVFLDLESTGLSGPGLRPRVTEVSVVAVHRGLLQYASRLSSLRVLDKLTLCVYPMKQVEPSAANITGLHNDALYHQKDFDPDLVFLLRSFLKRHESPICLIAHNGSRFDFPLMRSELQGIDEDFPSDVMCADSLLMFRDLDEIDSCEQVTGVVNSCHVFTPKRTDTEIQMKNSKDAAENENSVVSVDDTVSETKSDQVLDSESNSGNVSESGFRNREVGTPIRDEHNLERINSGVKRKLEFAATEIAKFPKLDNSDALITTVSATKCEENTDVSSSCEGQGESIDMCSSVPDELLLEAHERFENTTSSGYGENSRTPSSEASSIIQNERQSQGETTKPNDSFSTCVSSSSSDNGSKPQTLSSTTSISRSSSQSQQVCSTTASSPSKHENHSNFIHSETQPSPLKNANTLKCGSSPRRSQNTAGSVCSPCKSTSSALSEPSPYKSKNNTSYAKRPSYKLGDIYERVVGKQMKDAHRAEDDCLALLRICQFQAEKVIGWIDAHATPWPDVPPMYPKSPSKRRPLSPGHFPYHDAL